MSVSCQATNYIFTGKVKGYIYLGVTLVWLGCHQNHFILHSLFWCCWWAKSALSSMIMVIATARQTNFHAAKQRFHMYLMSLECTGSFFFCLFVLSFLTAALQYNNTNMMELIISTIFLHRLSGNLVGLVKLLGGQYIHITRLTAGSCCLIEVTVQLQ